MPVERARRIYHERSWGVSDLRPLGPETGPDHKTGEVWFEREDHSLPEPSLCLKLLFASQPLSIQVHPDDDYAHTLGLPFGKTEAWYVVNATAAIIETMPLERAADAYAKMMSGKARFRMVLTMT
jgi:mannose-6-phosphate isomerase